jgi:hypothetical protein
MTCTTRRHKPLIEGDQRVSAHLTITVQCIRTIPTQLLIWRWPSQNTIRMWTVLYWTRSSRTQFGVSINIWRLAWGTLNITCKFLYCNHQEHRDFHPVPANNIVVRSDSLNIMTEGIPRIQETRNAYTIFGDVFYFQNKYFRNCKRQGEDRCDGNCQYSVS